MILRVPNLQFCGSMLIFRDVKSIAQEIATPKPCCFWSSGTTSQPTQDPAVVFTPSQKNPHPEMVDLRSMGTNIANENPHLSW